MKAVMYHYVRPFDERTPLLKNLDYDDFCKQLDHFEKEYGFIEKSDFLSCLSEGKTQKGVVLTFDDGLICHYKFAFKELQKRGLWGIFYIPTGVYTKNKLLDVHRIHLLLSMHNSKALYNDLQELIVPEMLTDEGRIEFKKKTYTDQLNDEYTLNIKRILNYYISYDFRDSVIDRLIAKYDQFGFDDVGKFYVSEDNLREMNDAGMIIGSHTISHPVLSKLQASAQRTEIFESFNFITSVCGELETRTFCYPYGGRHSYTEDTVSILSEAGTDFSFSVEPNDISAEDIQNRRQELPRYDCNQFPYGNVRN